MASPMVYANPFGAAADGQLRGIDAALNLGKAGRDFRDADQENAYKVWHDPYRRNEAAYAEAVKRQQAAMATLQGATAAGIASGNFDPAQAAVKQYYNVDPRGQRTPDQTQTGFVYGAFNPQLSIGDVSSAGGASKLVPQTPMSPVQQQIQQASEAAQLEYWKQDPYRIHQQPPAASESQGGMDITQMLGGAPPPIPGAAPPPAPPPISFPGGGPLPGTGLYNTPSSQPPVAQPMTQTNPQAYNPPGAPMDFSQNLGSHDWPGWGSGSIGGVTL